MALVLQLVGSLIAILLLAWLAHRLGLGGDMRIRDEAHAKELSEDALFGFEPTDIAIDRAGMGALLRDADDRVMLLRRHGTHFAARLLDGHGHVRLDRTRLTLATSDRRFGGITLDLGEQAPHWAASLRRLEV